MHCWEFAHDDELGALLVVERLASCLDGTAEQAAKKVFTGGWAV
jgi:hypothetical protein